MGWRIAWKQVYSNDQEACQGGGPTHQLGGRWKTLSLCFPFDCTFMSFRIICYVELVSAIFDTRRCNSNRMPYGLTYAQPE